MENAIFTLMDAVLISLNHQQQIAGMFCNLSKASDCLNYVILLHKLFHYRVQETCDYWIKLYLTNRKQKVNMSTQNPGAKSSSNWKKYINKILPKLSSECFVVRSIESYSYISPLKMIYFSYFHAIMENSILFRGELDISQKSLPTTGKNN